MWRRPFAVVVLIVALLSGAGCGTSRSLSMDQPQSARTPTPPVDKSSTPGSDAEPPVVASATVTAPLAAPSPTAEPEPVSRGAPPLPPVEKALITHGDRSLPVAPVVPVLSEVESSEVEPSEVEPANIALTFDACQTAHTPAGYDAAIIDVLIETETPATLFLGGLWMQSHPTQTRALAANPLFELGNHSWSHLDFAQISSEEMSAEILRTQDIMHELTGRQPRLFRLPYGTYTDEALAVVAQHGLHTIQWDVVTGDPDPDVSAEAMVNAVMSQARDGSIVIMHMNTRGWNTAEALPDMIDGLSARGFSFVTVSELLGLDSRTRRSETMVGRTDGPLTTTTR